MSEDERNPKQERYTDPARDDDSESNSGDPSDAPDGEFAFDTDTPDVETAPSEFEASYDGDTEPVLYRNNTKEGRSPLTLQIGPEEEKRLQRLRSEATREFHQKVYYSDVKLAALVAGLRASDDEILDELAEMGYQANPP